MKINKLNLVGMYKKIKYFKNLCRKLLDSHRLVTETI